MGTRRTAENKMAYIRQTFLRADKEGKVINEKEFLAEFCVNFSATLYTAKQYLQIALDSKQVERTVDGLVPWLL